MVVQKDLFAAVMMFCLVVFLFSSWTSRLPDVSPQSAPDTEFSAERAASILQYLLQEDAPHPVGSAANKVVKDRIITWLNDAEIVNEVQEGWGCSKKWNSCAYVENIIAYLPGEMNDAPYVALMAHYDSESMTPGAGDDGSGVVAILESARALKAMAPLGNPIMMILTDAEETGSHGAERFFEFHPKASRIGAILNFDSGGTSGPSQILRTTSANSALIESYQDAASFPAGTSLALEVFKRMSNNSDFSVSTRAGVPGIEFMIAGERNHYHTPNDIVKNLNLKSLQHQGENLLPTAVRLANLDLTKMDSGKRVYMATFGYLFQWPAHWSPVLLGLSLILLVTAGYKWSGSIWHLLGASTLVPIVIIAVTSLVAWLAFELIEEMNGTIVGWPAHPWPFRLVLFSSMALPGLVVARIAGRRLPFETGLLGVWIFWWVLALLLVIFLPDAANLLLIPLLPASFIVCLCAWTSWPDTIKSGMILSSLILVVPHTLDIALALEATQGYQLIASTFFGLALYLVTISPMARGRTVQPAIMVSLVLLLGGLISATYLPLYSEWRPQHVNIEYIQNSDTRLAHWHLPAENPPPQAMLAHADFSMPNQKIFPWTTKISENLAQADYQALIPPSLSVLDVEPRNGGRRIKLKLRSERHADFLKLVLPASSNPLTYYVGGSTLVPELGSFSDLTEVYTFEVYGIQDRKEVELTIDFATNSPVRGYLLDGTTRLPPGADRLLAARPPLASPVGVGDRALVYKEVSF